MWTRRSYWCTKSEARITARCEFWLGARRKEGEYPLWSLTDEQQSTRPKSAQPFGLGRAAPAPRRVADSLNRISAIRLASAFRVIRRRSQRCYTSLRLGALGKSLSSDSARARSEKQQEEALRRAAPDARERIPTGAGTAARSYHFYCAYQQFQL